jgi:hypothetical protein
LKQETRACGETLLISQENKTAAEDIPKTGNGCSPGLLYCRVWGKSYFVKAAIASATACSSAGFVFLAVGISS